MAGVIDFGDICFSFTVCEVAVAMGYIMINAAAKLIKERAGSKNGVSGDISSIFSNASTFLAGYCETYPLTPEERKCVVTLAACRIAMSVTYGNNSIIADPTNEYLKLHAVPGWFALEALVTTPREKVNELLQVE